MATRFSRRFNCATSSGEVKSTPRNDRTPWGGAMLSSTNAGAAEAGDARVAAHSDPETRPAQSMARAVGVRWNMIFSLCWQLWLRTLTEVRGRNGLVAARITRYHPIPFYTRYCFMIGTSYRQIACCALFRRFARVGPVRPVHRIFPLTPSANPRYSARP